MPLRRMSRELPRARSSMLAVAFLLASIPAAAQPVDPWDTGTEWFSVRAGYAKSTAQGAADGNVGVGFAYTRFHNSKWAYGATAQWEVLGRFGSARELEMPWTLDVSRHYRWATDVRPFLGFGLGAYYHNISGTTNDGSTVVPGGYFSGGFNAPVSDRGLLGLDVRMNVVQAQAEENPVFGGDATTHHPQNRVLHWSAQLGYSWVF